MLYQLRTLKKTCGFFFTFKRKNFLAMKKGYPLVYFEIDVLEKEKHGMMT